MAAWLLIHSPFVGAAIWTPVAAELRQRGQETVVPDLTSALSGCGDHASRHADLVAVTVERGPVVLVAHSGAGPLLPLIAHRLAQQNITVPASVFVDAGLPHPGRSALDALPPLAVEQLRKMTVEGWLPPWTSWWAPERLHAMLPNEQLRSLLVDSCPQLPASLFSEVLPNLSDHELGKCSYVRLSSVYDIVADQTEQTGWPVRRLERHHIAILTSPAEVADNLQDVADTAGDAAVQWPPGGTSSD
jgi:hypothetical protein